MTVIPALINPRPLANVKVNNELQTVGHAYYGETVVVPFGEVAKYTTNLALIFYIGANVYASYVMNEIHGREKYVYYALMLYVIQIVYNFLDINSSSNMSRLEKITGA